MSYKYNNVNEPVLKKDEEWWWVWEGLFWRAGIFCFRENRVFEEDPEYGPSPLSNDPVTRYTGPIPEPEEEANDNH